MREELELQGSQGIRSTGRWGWRESWGPATSLHALPLSNVSPGTFLGPLTGLSEYVSSHSGQKGPVHTKSAHVYSLLSTLHGSCLAGRQARVLAMAHGPCRGLSMLISHYSPSSHQTGFLPLVCTHQLCSHFGESVAAGSSVSIFVTSSSWLVWELCRFNVESLEAQKAAWSWAEQTGGTHLGHSHILMTRRFPSCGLLLKGPPIVRPSYRITMQWPPCLHVDLVLDAPITLLCVNLGPLAPIPLTGWMVTVCLHECLSSVPIPHKCKYHRRGGFVLETALPRDLAHSGAW